jgi:predicted SAM-dependent methyltransferase
MSAFDRFGYQRAAVASTTGLVLNVGCNEDPAMLKAIYGDRVRNCDVVDYDEAMSRPNNVDVLFDAAIEEWPFDEGAAELVVLGDILEHLSPDEAASVLEEAHRVSHKLCVTVPCDERPESETRYGSSSNPYQYHRTVVTRELLERLLGDAGWTVDELLEVDYGFVPLGFVVRARR